MSWAWVYKKETSAIQHDSFFHVAGTVPKLITLHPCQWIRRINLVNSQRNISLTNVIHKNMNIYDIKKSIAIDSP